MRLILQIDAPRNNSGPYAGDQYNTDPNYRISIRTMEPDLVLAEGQASGLQFLLQTLTLPTIIFNQIEKERYHYDQ